MLLKSVCEPLHTTKSRFFSPSSACSRKDAELQFVLRHPNLVEAIAFSLGDDVHPPCLVMERMGESLFDLLGLGLTIGFATALGIVLDVCKVSRGCGSKSCCKIG